MYFSKKLIFFTPVGTKLDKVGHFLQSESACSVEVGKITEKNCQTKSKLTDENDINGREKM